MPYDHTSTEKVEAVNADKRRIERILIDTPSDKTGAKILAEYKVTVIFSVFDDVTGEKIPEPHGLEVVEWVGGTAVNALLSLPTDDGETLGATVKRNAFERAIVKGEIPAGGTIS